MHFDPDARVFAISNWHKVQLCDNFSSVILTTAAMKMGKRHFFCDDSNGC